jgi:trans-2,3-dihydro-3-hydroxyanthranilate isomerase
MESNAASQGERTLPFGLVDVFARAPLSGNGLCVFLLADELPELTAPAMQRITQEMRQFETIFLRRSEGTGRFQARIFTMEEELPFAGHPILGAAAFLHAELFSVQLAVSFDFVTLARNIPAASRRVGEAYLAEMDQGAAVLNGPIARGENNPFLEALNLTASDLAPGLPLQVVSTGLPYLIVPIRANLERARIVAADFEALLFRAGARFVYVLDVDRREGRTWDNAGRVEDIATGSAAGPAAAYLVRHGLASPGEDIVLAQGRFLGRPSELHAAVTGGPDLQVTVKGQVCFVGRGTLTLPAHLLES